MPFVPAPRTYECVVKGTVTTQPWVNIWHVRRQASTTEPTPAEVAGWFWVRWSAQMLPGMSNNALVSEVTVRDIGSQFAPQGVLPVSPQQAGAITGDCLPANVSFLFQKLTGFTGRMHRGRSYLPGVPEAQSVNAGGGLTAGIAAGWNTRLEAFRASLSNDIGGTSMECVLVSRVQGGIPRAEAKVTQITSIICSPWVATQRDRLKRGA